VAAVVIVDSEGILERRARVARPCDVINSCDASLEPRSDIPIARWQMARKVQSGFVLWPKVAAETPGQPSRLNRFSERASPDAAPPTTLGLTLAVFALILITYGI
jgi:hypothetical protein